MFAKDKGQKSMPSVRLKIAEKDFLGRYSKHEHFLDCLSVSLQPLLEELSMFSLENLKKYAFQETENLKKDFVQMFMEEQGYKNSTKPVAAIIKRQGETFYDNQFAKYKYKPFENTEYYQACAENIIIENGLIEYKKEFLEEIQGIYLTDAESIELYKKHVEILGFLNDLTRNASEKLRINELFADFGGEWVIPKSCLNPGFYEMLKGQ